MTVHKTIFQKQLFVNSLKDRSNPLQLHQLEQEGTERFLALSSRFAAIVHRPLHMTHMKGLATRAYSSVAISFERVGFFS